MLVRCAVFRDHRSDIIAVGRRYTFQRSRKAFVVFEPGSEIENSINYLVIIFKSDVQHSEICVCILPVRVQLKPGTKITISTLWKSNGWRLPYLEARSHRRVGDTKTCQK